MAELFFEDDRMGVQDPNYNNQLQSTSFQQPNINSYQYGMGQRFNTPNNWRGNLQHTYGMPGITGPNMRDVGGEVGEYGQIPGQGNVDMYTPQRNIFSRAKNTLGNFKNRIGKGITGILDNTIMGRIAAGFDPTNPRSGNFNPMLEGQLQNYKAQGFRVNDQGQAIDGPLAGQNLESAFGTNDVTAMLRNQLQKLRGYTYKSTIKAKKVRDLQAAIKKQREAENRGYQGTPGGNVGSGVFSKIDQSSKTYGPYTGWEGKGTKSSGGGLGTDSPASGKGGWGPGARKDGGRIGYNRGRVVNPGGYKGDEEGGILEWLQSKMGSESETNPTVFGTQNSLLNQGSIGELQNAIKNYEAFMMMEDLDEEQQADYELKLQQLSALTEGAEQKAHGGRAGFKYGGLASIL